MLDAALAEYQKKTGDDLLAHWLANELRPCESVDAVLDILRDQAKAFERSDDQKLMKWIDPLVHVLYTFSGALGDGVGVVCSTNLFHVQWILTFTFERRSLPRKSSLLGLVSSLASVFSLSSLRWTSPL